MKRLLAAGSGIVLFISAVMPVSAVSVTDLQMQLQSILGQIAQYQSAPGSVQGSAAGIAQPAATTDAPASCKTWYDGCNTCTRAYEGGPLSCTAVQCVWNAGSSCKEYFAPTSGTMPAYCALGTPSMRRGMSGTNVVAIQEFLRGEGLLSANATGYFGAATEAALQRWQSQQGIVSSGSAHTTGWGAVGPRTWATLKLRCTPIVGGDRDAHGCIGSAGYTWCASKNTCLRTWEQSCDAPTVCTEQYAPVCGQVPGCANNPCTPGKVCNMMCLTHVPQTFGNRCQLNAAGATYLYDGQCVDQNANQPPTISGLSGPTTLSVNQSGTWSVQASDPENQSLSYSITWGDEPMYPMMMNASVSSPVFSQTSTFTHAYSQAGTYIISVTVTDAQGKSAQTTTTVRVGTTPVACTMEYAPVCGQPAEPACRHSYPACLIPTPAPQTYGNRCTLDAAGATFLYTGTCSGSTY